MADKPEIITMDGVQVMKITSTMEKIVTSGELGIRIAQRKKAIQDAQALLDADQALYDQLNPEQ